MTFQRDGGDEAIVRRADRARRHMRRPRREATASNMTPAALRRARRELPWAALRLQRRWARAK